MWGGGGCAGHTQVPVSMGTHILNCGFYGGSCLLHFYSFTFCLVAGHRVDILAIHKTISIRLLSLGNIISLYEKPTSSTRRPGEHNYCSLR